MWWAELLNNLVAQLGTGAGAAASSFESIATATPSGVSTITFSSIPSTYKHLQVRINAIFGANGNGVTIRLNGDTAQNYTRHNLYGNGTTVSASGAPTGVGLTGADVFGTAVGGSTTYPAGAIVDLQDYTSANKKTIRSFSGVDKNGFGEVNLISSLWTGSASVTSLEVYSGTTFATGTTIALYGIKG